MDADRFDAVLAALAAAPSRRAALRLLSGLGLAGLFGPTDAKKKKKKKKCAKAGQAASKKRKKGKKGKKGKKCCAGLVPDGSGVCVSTTSPPPPSPPSPPSPPPPPCVPAACPANACGSVPDGCGEMLNCGGCPGNQICLRSGVCQSCSVTCTGTPTECGSALQMALEAGGTIHVCPGVYRGNFTPNDAVAIIGAGEGADPGSNTILDGGAASRVLTIPSGAAPVTLERLRITDGRELTTGINHILGGGILHQGTRLHLTECTVSGNFLGNNSQSAHALGGGIAVDTGSILELTRCTVRDNHIIGTIGLGGGIWTFGTAALTDCLVEANATTSFGGGLYVGGGTTTMAGTNRIRRNSAFTGGGIYVDDGTLAIAETCRVTQNTATGGAGGISNQADGTVTLMGANPSPIVVNNCPDNCGGLGGVPKCSTAPPVSCPP